MTRKRYKRSCCNYRKKQERYAHPFPVVFLRPAETHKCVPQIQQEAPERPIILPSVPTTEPRVEEPEEEGKHHYKTANRTLNIISQKRTRFQRACSVCWYQHDLARIRSIPTSYCTHTYTIVTPRIQEHCTVTTLLQTRPPI